MQNTHGRSKEVNFELEAEPCWVEGHADRLSRAVGNLLDNARKWSPPGQSVSVVCKAGKVVVHDHGPGIAEEDLPHIFDRFYRSPAARGLPGSGLGLAIVAQVVKAEGGTITAENDPAGGARMSMRLPTVPGLGSPDRGATRVLRIFLCNANPRQDAERRLNGYPAGGDESAISSPVLLAGAVSFSAPAGTPSSATKLAGRARLGGGPSRGHALGRALSMCIWNFPQ